MKRKILLMISFLLVVSMLAGCKSSANSNGKLPLTKENVEKVFADQYTIDHINLDWHSVDATFVSKKNVTRKDTAKLIKDIQSKIHENFEVNNSNSITLDNYDRKLLGKTDNKNKIIVGYEPSIDIETEYSSHKYSMSTKFNLLNPSDDVKITATDKEDGNITNKVKLKNSEVLTKLGEQTLVYEVTDSDGNTRTNELDIEVTK